MKRPALQNKRVAVLGMALRARKVFGTFEKWAPGLNVTTNFTIFRIFRWFARFCKAINFVKAERNLQKKKDNDDAKEKPILLHPIKVSVLRK